MCACLTLILFPATLEEENLQQQGQLADLPLKKKTNHKTINKQMQSEFIAACGLSCSFFSQQWYLWLVWNGLSLSVLRAVLWSSADLQLWGTPARWQTGWRAEGWVGQGGDRCFWWKSHPLLQPQRLLAQEVTPSSTHGVGGDWLAGHPHHPCGLPGSTSEQRALPLHFIYFIPVGLWLIYI